MPVRNLALFAVLASTCLCGCSYSDRPLNSLAEQVDQFHQNTVDRAEDFTSVSGRTISNAPTQKPYFLGVAISGGGSRSANFSAACLFEMQRDRLLANVDCISAVSGGSLAAAYFCSQPDDRWTLDAAQHALSDDFAQKVLIDLLLPWNAFALLASDYDRSDLLTQEFTRAVFHRADGKAMTFADLRRDRPRLLINATDLQSGKPFVFSDANFDQINADLSAYPLAAAVVASSAVPVALHPVTLRDFSTSFPRYVHLIDGGIYDNLGVQTLVNSYEAAITRDPCQFDHGAVIIVIDAGTQYDATLSELSDVGLYQSARAGLGLSSTALLNRAERATLSDLIVMHSSATRSAEDLRQDIAQFQKNHYFKALDVRNRPVWIVHVSLSQVGELTHLPSPSFVSGVNDISTNFDISPNAVNDLYQAARLLFSERFSPLLRKIDSDLREKP